MRDQTSSTPWHPAPTSSFRGALARLARRGGLMALALVAALSTTQAQVQFTDVSAGAGIDPDTYSAVTFHSLGVNWIDYDNDDWPDLFLVNGTGLTAHLYHNEGDGTFTKVDFLLPALPDVEMSGSVFADYDNDGDSDIYIFTDNTLWDLATFNPPDGPANMLLQNLWEENGRTTVPGQPLFQEVANAVGVDDLAVPPLGVLPGLRSKAGGWVDYDRDGWVDLYVAHMVMGEAGGEVSNRDRLFRNVGGTFQDVTVASEVNPGTDPDTYRPTLAFIAGHLNNDLDPDLYVVNISAVEPSPIIDDFIFINDGDSTFTDLVTVIPNLGDDAQAGMGIDLADVDLDGDWDIYMSDQNPTLLDEPPQGNVLYLNNGDGTFADNSAPAAGVSGGDSCWGVSFFDMDHDGDEDLFVSNGMQGGAAPPNFLFLNDGTGNFTNIAATSGFSFSSESRGTATADYDGDGDLDLAMVDQGGTFRLFRNDTAGQGNWLQVELRAVQSNRDAIGTLVEVDAGPLSLMRQIEGGSSAHSQDSLVLHFGLDTQATVDEIRVFWPSGVQDTMLSVAANSVLTLAEETTVNPRPFLDVSTLSLDLGQATVGNSVDRTITVVNDGTQVLDVTALTTAGPFSIVDPATPFSVPVNGGEQVVTVRYTAGAAGVEAGTLDITSNDPDQPLLSVALSGEGTAAPTAEFRINVGGADLTDVNGDLFVADKPFVAGDFGFVATPDLTATFDASPVAGTTDDLLYQTLRGGSSYSYLFDLASGDYDVTLYFMEPFFGGAGSRQFDVTIEGALVLDNFDIAATAGGTYTAHTESFTTTVGDGQLNIDFAAVVDPNVIVSAIAVVALPPEPDIGSSTSSLDFGTVTTGTSSDLVVTISNDGGADLDVTSLTTTNPAFTVLTAPFTILAGGSPVDVTVRFSPVVAGAEAGDLELVSNDPDESPLVVTLSGVGQDPPPDEPDIDVAPASLGFGNVFVGTSSDLTVTVSNLGTQPLTVNSLSVTPDFSVVSPAAPFTILAGGAPVDVTLRFAPVAAGAQAADLDIASDDPDEGLVTVPLTGTGIDPATGEFRINIGGADLTDINGDLFVADKPFVAGDFGFVATPDLTATFDASPVAGTTDDLLYQTLRGGPSYSYLFDLASGDYDVTLYFMEPFFGGAGSRQFDVTMEGVLVLDNFDIVAAAGGTYTAHSETFTTTVSDGQLNIDFAAVVDPNVIVSAIAVVALLPEPDISVSASSLDFGTVTTGTSSDLVVTVSNDGTDDLDVTSLTTTNPVFTVLTAPFTIVPGGAPVDVTVRFSPVVAGAEAGDLQLVSNDPDESPLVVSLSGVGEDPPPIEPDISVLPLSLDFGSVATGTSSDLVVTVSNDGTDDLNVTSLTTTNPLFTVLTAPFTILSGGAAVDVTVRFSPVAVGPESGNLELVSNDPDESPFVVSLDGSGVADEPEISVSPTSLDFGSVSTGTSSDLVVTVSNDGTQDLDVTALSTTNPLFTVLTAPFTILSGGAAVEVTVRFSPVALGVEVGDLELTSNDPDEGLVTVPLSGEGTPAAFRINVGGADLTDVNGDLFVADKAFVAGDFGFVATPDLTQTFDASPVAGTTDDLLYQSLRGGSSYSYLFDLASGDYDVTLYFMEPFFSGAGSRQFDVTVEGVLQLDNFDIVAAAGATYTAHTESFVATVADGQLNIDFAAVVDPNVIVSAIAVVAQPPAGAPDIFVNTTNVAFGELLVGTTGDQPLTVINNGVQTLSVTNLTTTNGLFTVEGPAVPFNVAAGGGTQEVTLRFSAAAATLEQGTLEITSNDPDQPLTNVSLIAEGSLTPQTAHRINAGGGDRNDALGALFVADKAFTTGDFGFVGGTGTTYAPSTVEGTTDDDLYVELREGSAFSYSFDNLPQGDWEVSLYYTEPIANLLNLRRFDVSMEGAVVRDDWDVFLYSGSPSPIAIADVGTLRAYRDTLVQTVSDGRLEIDFAAVVGTDAIVSAIAVQPVPPTPPAGYVDVAAQVGIIFNNEREPSECDPPIGTGSAWADYDGDGDIDLFTTNHGGPNRLYQNQGDTNADNLPDFIDVALAAGVDDPTGLGHSAVFIDYDNDTDQDLYVTNWSGNTLYQNRLVEDATATFLDVTATAGLANAGRAVTSAWGDFDNDGDLDVYVTKHFTCMPIQQDSVDALYQNNGNGTFTDRTDWLCGGAAPCARVSGLGFAAGWLDYDNDGDPDLYLVNDDIDANFYPNVLWENAGPDGGGGWIFNDVSLVSGAGLAVNGMGLGIGDYDNDGWLDLAFSNISPNNLLRNLGGGTFEEVSALAGVQRGYVPDVPDLGDSEQWTWGTSFFDHDNDGWLDVLYVAGNLADDRPLLPSAFFGNNQDGTFTNLTSSSGLGLPGRGRNVSIVDFDGDGFLDVFIANIPDQGPGTYPTNGAPWLFHNQAGQLGNTNNWLLVTVHGDVGNGTNVDGIGARVSATTPSGTQIREITSGASHGGGDYKGAYFGLGSHVSADIVVVWPNGTIDTLNGVAAGQECHVEEGTNQCQP